MSTTTDIDTRLTPVDAALTELDTALDQLAQIAADDGLPSHDALATVAFARRFETVRNKPCHVDQAVIDLRPTTHPHPVDVPQHPDHAGSQPADLPW